MIERKIVWKDGSPEQVLEQIQMLFQKSVRDAYSCRLFGQCLEGSVNIQTLLAIAATIVNPSHEPTLAEMILDHLPFFKKEAAADLVGRVCLGAHQVRVLEAIRLASS